MEDGVPNRHSQSHSWKDLESDLYEGLDVIPTRSIRGRRSKSQMSSCSSESDITIPDKSSRYGSYMEKEIMEQPKSIQHSMLGRVDFEKSSINLKGIENFIDEIWRCRRILIIGAASSFHVGIACRQIIEELLEVPVFVELASDFLDREVPIFRDDVCILISQSGETSSVLMACMYCKHRDALTMGITNEENSRLSHETHFGINLNAGVEIGVTSTKTYTSQFIVLVMFALKMAMDKRSKRERVENIIAEMKLLPEKIEKVLKLNDELKELAKTLVDRKSLLVMGRGYQLATSLEGSFKFKEIVNIHSESIHAGELKHGPLALIDENMPLIMVIVRDEIYGKNMNAIQQVKARSGRPIVICEEDDDETKHIAHTPICIPKTADCLSGILAVIPFQLLSMHLALIRGKSVDSPKNLQKTVIEEY